jgi:hypothetical protein
VDLVKPIAHGRMEAYPDRIHRFDRDSGLSAAGVDALYNSGFINTSECGSEHNNCVTA